MIGAKFGLFLIAGVCATAQVLWKEPPPTTALDWTWGPGGQELAPRPPFRFVKEKLGGSNPKVEVRDAMDRRWIVKFGSEAHTDTFAARLVSALGYAAEPTFYIESGTIGGLHDLKRAKRSVSKNGEFHKGRFKLRVKGAASDEADEKAWAWNANPFIGSPEFGGLKVLMMLTSNWDAKDARDGKGSNTGIIGSDSDARYAVTDWGASFGKSGGFFRRDRWDWNGYRAQTADFVRLKKDGSVAWGFKGKHDSDITKGVGLSDIVWLNRYLARITDEDVVAGFLASGASKPVASEYARLMRQRIVQLQNVASQTAQRASK